MKYTLLILALGFFSFTGLTAQHTCEMKFEEDNGTMRAFSSTELHWENGRVLKVKFIKGGSPLLRAKVEKYAKEWTQNTGVQFEFVESGAAEIRISFYPESGDTGSWSWVGRGALKVPTSEATMNYGWLYDNTDEQEIHRVVYHEFGHALGIQHEHQHPDCPIVWDKEAVYRAFSHWPKSQVDRNLFRTYDPATVTSTSYDRTSIMHYYISNSWTIGDFEVGNNFYLSTKDYELIEKIYPKEIDNDKDKDGYTADVDCDDTNPDIHPNAREDSTNGVDDNCNDLVDERDEDGDGFLTYTDCLLPELGCPELDCDDTNEDIYPGAKEIANNGIDEDCNNRDVKIRWQVFYGGTSNVIELNQRAPLTSKMENLLVGDFNGDGTDDILRAAGNNWVYFVGGGEELVVLDKNIKLKAEDLLVGDFDGDGTSDILHATGNIWRVAYAGKRPWFTLQQNTALKERLHIGDFDGDGQDDIAVISMQKVKYSSGGTGPFIFTEGETFKQSGFLIADFNGDGQDDIFCGNGTEWRVLYSAIGSWTTLRNQTTSTDQLKAGYFNAPIEDGQADKQADIFKATSTQWRAWYGGQGAQKLLKTNTETTLLMGDFNGDGQTDVMKIKVTAD